MRSIRFNLFNMRPIRFLLAACVCALLVFSHAFPAYSAPPVNPIGSKIAPQKGESQLLGIERKAQETVLKDPLSQEKVQGEAPLNEIQGEADADKFKRPENSQAASSVEDKLETALESVTGKK